METYEVLTASGLPEKLTSSPADSPASLFPQSENEQGQETTAISGRRCLGLLERSGRDGLLAKTLMKSTWPMGEYGKKYGLVWKIWVTTSRDIVFLLLPLERPTSGTGLGLLPTPRAKMGIQVTRWYAHKPIRVGTADSFQQAIARHIFEKYPHHNRFCLHPRLMEMAMGYPENWVKAGTKQQMCHALGNAIVPQVALKIFEAINEHEKTRQPKAI